MRVSWSAKKSNQSILKEINPEYFIGRTDAEAPILCSPDASSVQSLSHVRLCDPMDCSTPGLPVHHQLPEFTQTHSIELMMPSNHLILCRPLLLLPLVPSSITVFSNESALCMRWPKYWSFSLSISPSNEHPGQFSFRMDWLDLLQSNGLTRIFSNTTIQKDQFFGAQLSS